MDSKPSNNRDADGTDESLVSEALAGSRASFERLVRRYELPLVRYLYGLTGDRQLSEDVFQETFLAVYTTLGQFNPKWRFSTWVYTIARRCCGKRMRKQSRFESSSLECEVADTTDLVDDHDFAHNLWAVIRTHVGPDEFTALWMRYVDDAATREIARVLGRSNAGTKMLLSRVRQRLRPLLVRFTYLEDSQGTITHSPEQAPSLKAA